MKDSLSIFSIKNTLHSGRYGLTGITIGFSSRKEVITSEYIYVIKDDCKKYFQILETSASLLPSDLLLYTAIECGYGKDKVSKDRNLDLRDYLNLDIFQVTSKEEAHEVRTSSSYT